tara:strand:- start:2820 stop:2972 length:153 start_codon:yes stop_codon:yes gene_type:complete
MNEFVRIPILIVAIYKYSQIWDNESNYSTLFQYSPCLTKKRTAPFTIKMF